MSEPNQNEEIIYEDLKERPRASYDLNIKKEICLEQTEKRTTIQKEDR